MISKIITFYGAKFVATQPLIREDYHNNSNNSVLQIKLSGYKTAVTKINQFPDF